MVLFYCTFLALRAQDSTNREYGTDGLELRREELKFSGSEDFMPVSIFL